MPSKALKLALRTANRMHVSLYRISGGKLANQVAGMPVLLITTWGRKTGRAHTNPVVYLRDGDDFLVTASAGGMDMQPGWYLNLKTNPRAVIQVRDQTVDVMATILVGTERDQLYEQFKAAGSNFVKYGKNTSRVIPVIRLIPVAAGVTQ